MYVFQGKKKVMLSFFFFSQKWLLKNIVVVFNLEKIRRVFTEDFIFKKKNVQTQYFLTRGL